MIYNSELVSSTQESGHAFEQTLGDAEGQGSLVCCGPWGHKELGTTEQPNNNIYVYIYFSDSFLI